MIREIILLIAISSFWQAANASEKVALVIGNSNYQHVSALDNPVRDARSISIALTSQGFDVTTIVDQTFAQMNLELRKFRAEADRAEVAMVYYAGHGIEVAGQNYLIPTDAALQDERDVQVQAINLNALLHQISGAKALKVVILDACRDNPFVAKMKRANAGRSVGRGLSLVEASLPGTLIAYAAAAGETTPDGPPGGNSPFTSAFVKTLDGEPVDVRRFFGKVRDNLQKVVPTAEPFLYSSLGGDEILIQKPRPLSDQTDVVETAITSSTPNDKLSEDFRRATEISTASAWRAFIELHGKADDSIYLRIAKDHLDDFEGEKVAVLPQAEYELVILDDPITWADAKRRAELTGGTLASLTTHEAHQRVWDLVRRRPEAWVTNEAGFMIGPWLGGFQMPGATEPDGGWVWVTGAPFEYDNWTEAGSLSGAQPNNTRGVEDALVFMGYKEISPGWNDYPSEPTGSGWQAAISAFVLER